MLPHAQQLCQSTSHIYPAAAKFYPTEPSLSPYAGLTNYMISDHQQTSPLPPRKPSMPHPTQQLPTSSRSHYPDFDPHYQSSPHEQARGYASSVDTRMDSPQDKMTAFDRQERSPISDLSGPASITSVMSHRAEMNSVGKANYGQRTGSIDESEGTSPSSSRSVGVRGSDESIPTTMSGGGMDGDGEDHKIKEEKDVKPPPWSELKTKAGKERKRLPLACIACRRKKIRCSGEKPACKHCLRSRIPCVYKVTARKAAPRTDYMTMLDKRLKRMEERVIKIIPHPDANKLASIGRAVVKPPSAMASKGGSAKKRAAEEAFGSELDDWAQSGTNQGHPHQAPGLDHAENRLLTEGAESLPPKEIQEHLAEVFFDCLYGQSYHVLHKPSFMRRLRAGTVPPVLILAVCATSARFSTHPQVSTEPAFLRGESWAKPARDIALRRYDEPNITILTVLLLLGLHEFGTCQGGRSWMLGGMAMRMAYALQLHRELDHDPLGQKKDKSSELSFTDREIRRRTMWACFLMDRFNSSGTERPTFANEENIKVQLPIKESHFQMEIPGPTESLDGSVPNPISPGEGQISNPKDNMGVAAYLVRIITIWGRVIKYWNLGGKEKDLHPLWDPSSQFTQLKNQADEFNATLPDRLKYSAETLQNHASEGLANQFLFLHISYNQVVLSLHKFAIPTVPGGRISKEMPKDFVSDAAKTSVDAASQISSLLNDASNHLVAAPFAGYCAFASSTVHIWGIFSKNPKLEASSKRNLAHNVKYLSKMKKHWGMFHYMAENLKDIYRQYADAALKGPAAGSAGEQESNMFQYGDWFTKYPHGVSGTDYEDPATESKNESGNDAALSQKSDLQSVEEFFNTLSSPERAENQRKALKRGRKDSQAQLPRNGQEIKMEQPQIPSLPLHPRHPSMLANMPPHHQRLDPSPYPHDLYAHPFSNGPFATPTLPVQQPHPLQELDRQLVFGAYASQDPTSTSASMPQFPAHGSGGGMWDSSMDFSQALATGSGGGGYGDVGSSAWFMPFNLNPPDIGADAEVLGLESFAMDGIGEERLGEGS